MAFPVEIIPPTAWISVSGLERWGHVLQLPLLPIELVEFKGTHLNQKHKGCFILNKTAAIIQPRVHREDLSPVQMFPLSLTMDHDSRHSLLSFWLNYAFRRFGELSAHQQQKITETIPLQHVMNGPSFLLMTGKSKAEHLIQTQDLI